MNAREVERKGRMPGKGKEQREREIKIGGNSPETERPNQTEGANRK